MREKPYHHGNLRRALIEMGIEFIEQEGEESLSLRKIAEMCGVSNAAPYAHFKTKDEFIIAMQQYVMDLFSAALEKTAMEYKDDPSLLPMLGKTYVMFFYQNPFYFDFLFSRKNISIKLSFDDADTDENTPLAILQKTATMIFRKVKLPEKVIQDKIIAMWALVHGLAAIVTMPNIEYDDTWETRIEEIIKSVSIPYQMQEDKE
ncbi:MAG: TetR/AcrR family transcriptional regulator [Lachnospiraceae bacterium]|jgi:AcrR family transcriptional regulator|nr:TetR/AcrR family transcriptional regulator [Lachnospiraceae bacterium]